MKKRFLAIIILTCWISAASGQDHPEPNAKVNSGRHRLAPLLGFTYVFNASKAEDHAFLGSLLVPHIGLDYAYMVAPRWAVGLYSDVELASYLIVKEDNRELRRERAFVTAVGVTYEVFHHFGMTVGYGVEIERNENFQVLKIGAAYGMPFRDQWDVGFGLTYDYKEIYHSLSISVVFEWKSRKKSK